MMKDIKKFVEIILLDSSIDINKKIKNLEHYYKNGILYENNKFSFYNNEISLSNQTRAFVLPNSYAPLIEKLSKEIEAKQWAKNKQKLLNKDTTKNNNIDDIMQYGMNSINEYLKEL